MMMQQCESTIFVVLDYKFCRKPHIKYLCGKIVKGIGILGKTKSHPQKSQDLALCVAHFYYRI